MLVSREGRQGGKREGRGAGRREGTGKREEGRRTTDGWLAIVTYSYGWLADWLAGCLAADGSRSVFQYTS